MNLSKIALGAVAGLFAFSPLSAMAQLSTATNTVGSQLLVPYECSIDNSHVVNLTNRQGVQSRWGGDANAVTVTQNGATLWSLNNWQDLSLPLGSVPRDARTRLSVDFTNNKGAAGAPGIPTSDDDTLHFYRDGAPQELVLLGSGERRLAVGAMITEDTGPLLAGAPYEFQADLTCVVAPGGAIETPQ